MTTGARVARRVRGGGEAGVTTLEVVMAAVIFAIIILVVGAMLRAQADDLRSTLVKQEMEGSMRRLLDDLTREIADAGPDRVPTHPRSATTARSDIRFSKRMTLESPTGAGDWSREITYELGPGSGGGRQENPNNKKDDDGDGLVDESWLRRRETGSGVPSGGQPGSGSIWHAVGDDILALTFRRVANTDYIEITLEVGRKVGEQVERRTLSTRVFLRNRE
jgi:hypothetical protein